MIQAERAIRDLRRDLTIGRLLKFAAGVAVAAALVTATAVGPGGSGVMVFVAVVFGTTVLGARMNRGSAVVAESPSLIAAGQFDEAEQQIERVLGTFWTLRSAKLVGLHHLAVLRHAQRQWRESALLAGAVLRLSRPGWVARWITGGKAGRSAVLPAELGRTARLMLADSAIELNDLPTAHDALAGLYADRLSLTEAMNLLVIQLEYEARLGAWAAMLANVGQKVQLAELLPAGAAGRAQGLLALAAGRAGRVELAAWLRRRVELLVDVGELVAQRPVLSDVFAVELGAAAEMAGAGPAESGADRGGTEVNA